MTTEQVKNEGNQFNSMTPLTLQILLANVEILFGSNIVNMKAETNSNLKVLELILVQMMTNTGTFTRKRDNRVKGFIVNSRHIQGGWSRQVILSGFDGRGSRVSRLNSTDWLDYRKIGV